MIFGLLKVSGHSMEPYLHSGQQVLAIGLLPIREGSVVVFRHDLKIFIKRIKSIKGEECFVEGDNKRDSLDSRSLGSIQKKDIIGTVVWRF